MGINFLKTAAGRRAEGKGVATLLHAQLKAGWNPHHQSIEDFLQQRHTPAINSAKAIASRPFNDALAFALEEKKPNLADKSYRGFKTCLDYAQRAATRCGIASQPIGETRKAHIKELLAQMVRDRQKDYDAAGKGMQVSGNFYNKYKGYLVCILSELVEYEALEYNPAVGLRDRPAIKTNIHRHATQQEREVIKSTLQLQHPEFYTYLATQYYAGIRPNEIFSIRICDIDWFSGYINLHPYEGGSKTRQSRRVPMPEELEKLFRKMGLEKRNPTWYLFSEYFLAGPKRKKRDYATKKWKEIVRDGLGLNVSLYSFKGLGGDDKREAGISLQAVSSQYGHTKLSTTMIYTHGEQARMDDELPKKTRAL
jgi:integrase